MNIISAIEIPMKMSKRFKKGDFVRVREGTHDNRMPASRCGHIIEEYEAIIHYSNETPQPTGVWKVLMTNGVIIRFHEMFLEDIK